MMCPVCGYGFLPDDAMDHDICPSCGTEFGYDDVTLSHEAISIRCLSGGGEWFYKSVGPPPGWDALTQVIAAFGEQRSLR